MRLLGLLLLLPLLGCSPRESAAATLRISLDQGYVLGQAEPAPRPVLAGEARRKHAGGGANSPAPGDCGNCSDPRALLVAAGVVAAVVVVYVTVQGGIALYHHLAGRPKDRPVDLALAFEAEGHVYTLPVAYGESTIRLEADLARDLAEREIVLRLVAGGAWRLDQRIPVGRWPAAGRRSLVFTGDGHVFVDGACVR